MDDILQCYAILGIKHTATLEEAKKAYRNMAKIWHPDRYTNNPVLKAKAEVEIKKINQAYAAIKACPTNSLTRVAESKIGYGYRSQVAKASKPISPESYYEQSIAYVEQGEYEAALNSLSQAIALDGDYLEAYQYRGFILSKLGYKLQADAEFKKAHQLRVKNSKKSYDRDTFQVKNNTRSASTTIKTQTSQPLKCDRTIMAGGTVNCIAVSSFSRIIASASDEGEIKLWQLNSGERIGTLDDHSDRVTCLTMSPSGQTLISGSQDNTIKFWDLRKKKVIRTLGGYFDGHLNHVVALAISPDNQTLLSCDADNSLKVWDVNRAREIHNISFSSAVTCLAFSPNNQLFCSGGLEPQIRIREVKNGQIVRSLNNTSAILSLAFSPNGKLLATGGFDRQIRLWDLATGKLVYTLTGHSDCVSTVLFSHDGQSLISSSWDRTIELWQLSTGKQVASAKVHSDRINALALTSDDRILVSGSADRTIRLWQCCLSSNS